MEGKYKVNDLIKVVKAYGDKIDNNGRYLSFNHCFYYFDKNYDTTKDEVKNLMTLYFYAYMASWGMLRNSFLLYKDYLFNKPIIELLCEKRINMKCKDIIKLKLDSKEIIKLKKSIVNAYKYEKNGTPNVYYKEEKRREINPKEPDTLVSKAILGTLGVVPAYDTFFKFSAKKMGVYSSLSERGLKDLDEFYASNKEDIDLMCKYYKYPPMKIVDMYFWQKAYECSTLSRIIDIINDKKINEARKKSKIDILLEDTSENHLLQVKITKPYNLELIKKDCEDAIESYYKKAMEK